jgi:Tfp pilus assembly protein PilP
MSTRLPLTVVLAGVVLSGAGHAAETQPAQPAPTVVSQPAQPAASPVAGATLRDPFRPLSMLLRPKRPEVPRTPLEEYDLGALKLVAIIYDTSNPKAMVEDAEGKGFSVGMGAKIGNAGGVVRTIEADRVVVEEEFVDFYGEKKKSETVLRLKPEGEKRP